MVNNLLEIVLVICRNLLLLFLPTDAQSHIQLLPEIKLLLFP
jgi:hypothetical protein